MENKHTRSVSLIDGHTEDERGITDTEKVLLELKSASEWFAKHGRNTNTAIIGICNRAVDLINRQQAEIKQLETIERVATKAIEKQDAEIEKLNVELVGMRGACESYKMHYDNAQAEVERLQKLTDAYFEVSMGLTRELMGQNSENSIGKYYPYTDSFVKEMTEVSE